MDRARDSEWRTQIEELEISSLVKLVIVIIVLLFLLVFVSVLPGLDQLVPGLPITFGAIVSAVVTLAIVLLLVRVAARIRTIIQHLLIDIAEIETHSTAVVYWTVVFLAVVIAYEGFEAATAPILVEAGLLWTYDLVFLLLGMIPLAFVGYHLFQLLDPLADWCVRKLRSDTKSDSSTIQTTLPIEGAEENDANDK